MKDRYSLKNNHNLSRWCSSTTCNNMWQLRVLILIPCGGILPTTPDPNPDSCQLLPRFSCLPSDETITSLSRKRSMAIKVYIPALKRPDPVAPPSIPSATVINPHHLDTPRLELSYQLIALTYVFVYLCCYSLLSSVWTFLSETSDSPRV